jgi:hypothetical protein
MRPRNEFHPASDSKNSHQTLVHNTSPPGLQVHVIRAYFPNPRWFRAGGHFGRLSRANPARCTRSHSMLHAVDYICRVYSNHFSFVRRSWE